MVFFERFDPENLDHQILEEQGWDRLMVFEHEGELPALGLAASSRTAYRADHGNDPAGHDTWISSLSLDVGQIATDGVWARSYAEMLRYYGDIAYPYGDVRVPAELQQARDDAYAIADDIEQGCVAYETASSVDFDDLLRHDL